MSLYLKSKQTGNSGEALVESSLSHHAIIHRVDGSKDVGLDMICEWVNGEKPTQTMFGIQVKTTENIKLRPKNNKSRLNQLEEFWGCITIEQKTLDYWAGFDFPVFVFLVDLKTKKIYYKRYTSIVHKLTKHTKELFYLATENNKFLAYVPCVKTGGFSRDLFFDHLRCQHNKGALSGVNPNDLGLKGWKEDALYKGVFDQYKNKIRSTYNRYQKWSNFFK